MTIEENLKNYILDNYKSLRNFVKTSGIDVPYSTIDGIFKRGIGSASIDNVFKICDTLGISADALIDGKIIPKADYGKKIVDVHQALEMLKNQFNLAVDGAPITDFEFFMIEYNVELGIELIRKRRSEIKESGSQSMLWQALDFTLRHQLSDDKSDDE